MPSEDECGEAAERLQDWLGYEHVVERVKFSSDQPKITFYFRNNIRVSLHFGSAEYMFNGKVTLGQFYSQFGSGIELKKFRDVYAIKFIYEILRGEAETVILKCEEEVRAIWDEDR